MKRDWRNGVVEGKFVVLKLSGSIIKWSFNQKDSDSEEKLSIKWQKT